MKEPFATKAKTKTGDPFKQRKVPVTLKDSRVHVIRKGVRCETEQRGYALPSGKSPLEIVLEASDGFIPLWAKETTLHYRFRDSSFEQFEDPDLAKAAVLGLIGEAILEWGDAPPVKFKRDDGLWDFEIVMRTEDDCNNGGCVLASAFFPDSGRHQLVIYPMMLTQSKEEQVETMAHEIGHIFGLRHFFAKVEESNWPSEIFGVHDKFSIMNYGDDSSMSPHDKTDLKKLYTAVWAGELTEINETPIRVVQPFHALKLLAESGDPLPMAAYVKRRVKLKAARR